MLKDIPNNLTGDLMVDINFLLGQKEEISEKEFIRKARCFKKIQYELGNSDYTKSKISELEAVYGKDSLEDIEVATVKEARVDEYELMGNTDPNLRFSMSVSYDDKENAIQFAYNVEDLVNPGSNITTSAPKWGSLDKISKNKWTGILENHPFGRTYEVEVIIDGDELTLTEKSFNQGEYIDSIIMFNPDTDIYEEPRIKKFKKIQN